MERPVRERVDVRRKLTVTGRCDRYSCSSSCRWSFCSVGVGMRNEKAKVTMADCEQEESQRTKRNGLGAEFRLEGTTFFSTP